MNKEGPDQAALVKMSWGSELWDKYSELTHHTQNGIDFLESSVAGLVKDRGKVEAEYAKALRGLAKKYAPKETSSSSSGGGGGGGGGSAGAGGQHGGGGGGGGIDNGGQSSRRRDEYTHMRAYKQVRRNGWTEDPCEVVFDSAV